MNMTDLFKINMETSEINRLSNLGLAHLGDAVYELMVRVHLSTRGITTPKTLHRQTVLRVSAPAQAEAAAHIRELLDDEERSVFLRGRNTKVNSVPHGATRGEYQNATALETLFGYLYLKGDLNRLNELFACAINVNEEGRF